MKIEGTYNGLSRSVDMHSNFARSPLRPATTPEPASRSSTRCGACSQAERRWRLPLYGVLRGDGGGMDPVRAWRRNRLPPKVRAICSPKIPSSLQILHPCSPSNPRFGHNVAAGMEGRGSGGGAKSVEAGCRSGEQGRCSSEGCGASANLPEAGAEELVQGSASAGVEEVRRRWACGWI